MASGRVLSHLLRFSSIRLLKPAASTSPRYPSPVPFSRLNSAGFLLSRAVQYATSAPAADDAAPPAKDPSAGPSGKITDEFTGAGAIGQICQVDGTEEIVREQRVLNTGSPITYATSAAAASKAPASPSAGPSSKITDEFTGAGAIEQRHAGGDTYSDKDGDDCGSFGYCLSYWEFAYGDDEFVYGSDDDNVDGI